MRSVDNSCRPANLRAARVFPGCSPIVQPLFCGNVLFSFPVAVFARLQARPGTAHATAGSSQRRLYKGPTDQLASADLLPVSVIDRLKHHENRPGQTLSPSPGWQRLFPMLPFGPIQPKTSKPGDLLVGRSLSQSAFVEQEKPGAHPGCS